MSKRLVALSTVAILLAGESGDARAQSSYEGKTLRLVVGFAPGGGFDTCESQTPNMTSKHAPTTTQPCRRGMWDVWSR